MAENLTGKKIKDTYPGLIKTNDNLNVSGTPLALTDGLGNELPLQISTTDVNFTGNVDFTGATVSGLPGGGGGGLVNGTGDFSLKNEDSLVETPADAFGIKSVAIGDNAKAGDEGVAIGINSDASGQSVSIGGGRTIDQGISIGFVSEAIGFRSVAIGVDSRVNGNFGIAIGGRAQENSTAINGEADNVSSVVIGTRNNISAPEAIGIGVSANPNQAGVAIGSNSSAGITAVALGHQASAVDDAVALGAGISAENPGWTKTTALELRDMVALDAVDDTAAAALGVPVGGLYHNAGVVRVRLS